MDIEQQQNQEAETESSLPTDETDVEDYVSSIIEAFDIDVSAHDAIYNAIQVTLCQQAIARHPSCDAHWRAHKTCRCRCRGLAFFPKSICKQVEQVDLKFGNKPIKPIPNIPLPPVPSIADSQPRPRPTFGALMESLGE